MSGTAYPTGEGLVDAVISMAEKFAAHCKHRLDSGQVVQFVPNYVEQRRDQSKGIAAAAYVGVSATKFDDWVSRHLMPKPKRIDGIVVWDRLELDAAFEGLPDEKQDADDAKWDDVSA